ncbi:MAG: HEPN domain-containing protein [Candidatus Brachytrichaceae bacterium NZ_4S206]|jgi:HEPN domain-containing protein
MIDVDKHVACWRDGAREEWELAVDLINEGRVRHALFFAHLTLEKILKAHVVKATGDVAPRTHNLISLFELTTLTTSSEQLRFLDQMNRYNIEGRYPDLLDPVPSPEDARDIMSRAEEIYQWLTRQL